MLEIDWAVAVATIATGFISAIGAVAFARGGRSKPDPVDAMMDLLKSNKDLFEANNDVVRTMREAMRPLANAMEATARNSEQSASVSRDILNELRLAAARHEGKMR